MHAVHCTPYNVPRVPRVRYTVYVLLHVFCTLAMVRPWAIRAMIDDIVLLRMLRLLEATSIINKSRLRFHIRKQLNTTPRGDVIVSAYLRHAYFGTRLHRPRLPKTRQLRTPIHRIRLLTSTYTHVYLDTAYLYDAYL